MLRYIGLIGLPLLLLASPASAVTAKQKMETCKFGADNEQLTGAKRNAFIKKCMAAGNYQPAARKEELKKERAAKMAAKKKTAMKPAAKKPMAAPAAAPPPAEPSDEPEQQQK
jgi:hypothetical protein